MTRVSPFGAAAGAGAVLLFAVGSLIVGERPGLDTPAGEVAAFFRDERSRVHVGLALYAAAAPLLVASSRAAGCWVCGSRRPL